MGKEIISILELQNENQNQKKFKEIISKHSSLEKYQIIQDDHLSFPFMSNFVLDDPSFYLQQIIILKDTRENIENKFFCKKKIRLIFLNII